MIFLTCLESVFTTNRSSKTILATPTIKQAFHQFMYQLALHLVKKNKDKWCALGRNAQKSNDCKLLLRTCLRRQYLSELFQNEETSR